MDKGYINNKAKKKKTSGKLFLKSPIKTVWFNNDIRAPVEVKITVEAPDGEKNLTYVEIKVCWWIDRFKKCRNFSKNLL